MIVDQLTAGACFNLERTLYIVLKKFPSGGVQAMCLRTRRKRLLPFCLSVAACMGAMTK